jgi:cytochrome c peroxidase
MYAMFSPLFHIENDGTPTGGLFLDGRAANLEQQAQGPLLNPLEMANPNKAKVVEKVRNAAYAPLFKQVFGAIALSQVEPAYAAIASAISAFERSSTFAPFSAKYDAYLAGQSTLTASEQRGLVLFEDPKKGNCAACHPSRPAPDGTPPLFTDFTYDNLGVPRNPDNPFYNLPPRFNPAGKNFVDTGLGQTSGRRGDKGRFKVPTLRNIALTRNYMHNGYFQTLRGVVDFYNTRDVKPACPDPLTREADALQQGCWPQAEVPETVNHEELGNLHLSEQEVSDIVAFMRTLTDGYWQK